MNFKGETATFTKKDAYTIIIETKTGRMTIAAQDLFVAAKILAAPDYDEQIDENWNPDFDLEEGELF